MPTHFTVDVCHVTSNAMQANVCLTIYTLSTTNKGNIFALYFYGQKSVVFSMVLFSFPNTIFKILKYKNPETMKYLLKEPLGLLIGVLQNAITSLKFRRKQQIVL